LLTDDNRHAIEWANGKIEVHNPPKLASEILQNYFRHSKYASFQRQLNYFGFRKLAGKGKMSPCSYVNDEITPDIRSLLRIKRKTTGSKDKKNDSLSPSTTKSSMTEVTNKNVPVVNPVLAGILKQSRHQDIKGNIRHNEVETNPHFKVAVGKGIRHKLNGYLKSSMGNSSPSVSPSVSLEDISSSAKVKPDDLAKTAVGRGIKHQFGTNNPTTPNIPTIPETNYNAPENTTFTFLDPHQLGMGPTHSLSELKSNFHNSFDGASTTHNANILKTNIFCSQSNTNQQPVNSTNHGMMSRSSSLVDLAMIPSIPGAESDKFSHDTQNMIDFLDFPQGSALNDMNII